MIRDLLSRAWDNLLGRTALLLAVLGWVPYTMLSMAHGALTR